MQLSEGTLAAERLVKDVARIARDRQISAHEALKFTFLIVAARMVSDVLPMQRASADRSEPTILSALSELAQANQPGEQDQAFARLLQEICRRLGIRRVQLPLPEFARGVLGIQNMRMLFSLVERTLIVLASSGNPSFIDGVFLHLFSQIVPSDRRHHTLLARLAAPLARLHGNVGETFPSSGEIFREIAEIDSSRTLAFDDHAEGGSLAVDTLALLRAMRLAMHNVGVEPGSSRDLSWALRVADRTLQVDPELYPNLPASLRQSPLTEVLLQHSTEITRPLFAAVLNGDTRRSIRDRWEFFERFGLRAFIEVDSYRPNGRLEQMNVFFFDLARQPADGVVVINARHLRPKKSDPEEVFASAALVGEVLSSLLLQSPITSERLERTRAPRRMLDFVLKGLARDRLNIPGFLKIVSRRELEEMKFSLRASTYLPNLNGDEWRASVEIDPLMRPLETVGSAVYVIGNNGQGKSLALRETAKALALSQKHSLGVSFGSTDRFESKPKDSALKTFFQYAGARSTRNGPSSKRSLGDLGDRLRSIRTQPQRAACLDVALATLGFEPRQYLVPVAMTSTGDQWETLVSEIHDLRVFDAAQADHPVLVRGEYKPAIVRTDSDRIVVFDSLSSGEQQILTMLIKVVSAAKQGSVVLLDEPEISLHVAWQRLLPEVLRTLAKDLECSFLVATHSPVLIASATGERDHCFQMTNGNVQELKPDQRRSVESSLFEGFETYTPFNHHVQERCAELVASAVAESSGHDDSPPRLDSELAQLKALREKLGRHQGSDANQDIALVEKAIAAIESISSLAAA